MKLWEVVPMKLHDKRSERRSPINILLNKYIDGEPHVCRAVNLSRGGMLLYKVFEPDMQREDEVSLEFQLPGSNRILRADGVTLAEHRWARAHGVRFTRMAEEDKELLERYLRGELNDDAVAL
jgi:hypothetical protein